MGAKGSVGAATPSAAAASGADNSSPAAEAYSTTNNQEVGVDEPDIVKTDGSTLYTVSGTKIEAALGLGDAEARRQPRPRLDRATTRSSCSAATG